MHDSAKNAISLEDQYGAHNYHPLPVVLSEGKGALVWDVNGKQYYDFLSSYSAVNQGHCHPCIIKALTDQAQKLTLTSRAFYNDQLGKYEAYIANFFGYQKVLPMNTGAEAVETTIKIARKWGYEKKGIPENNAQIIVCQNNFHGRTTTIISFSNDTLANQNFGPFTPGFISIPYDDINALGKVLSSAQNIVGLLVEPIQGEAGVLVPAEDYLTKAAALCKEKNVLLMVDEIQTGIARTGSLLASCGDCECDSACKKQGTRADILILGKALSGGVYPVSAVLADNSIMEVIKPGQHGSTFGGNPLACAVATTALEVVKNEALSQKARKMGRLFRERMHALKSTTNLIKEVRGKGLLNAIEINDSPDSDTAWNVCVDLMRNGLLAKPTHGNIIRFAPPLVISQAEMEDACSIIESVIGRY